MTVQYCNYVPLLISVFLKLKTENDLFQHHLKLLDDILIKFVYYIVRVRVWMRVLGTAVLYIAVAPLCTDMGASMGCGHRCFDQPHHSSFNTLQGGDWPRVGSPPGSSQKWRGNIIVWRFLSDGRLPRRQQFPTSLFNYWLTFAHGWNR